MAGPQRGRRGDTRTEEGEKSIAMAFIRRSLSLAAQSSPTPYLADWRDWGDESVLLLGGGKGHCSWRGGGTERKKLQPAPGLQCPAAGL